MKKHRGTSIGTLWMLGVIVAVFAFPILWVGAPLAAETPRYGGTLIPALRGAPSSWDAHQETSINTLHPGMPFYSTLLKFDPENYPKIVGDVAESWTASKDYLVYTFKIRKNVRFHDGTPMTARDIKASLDHFIFPPQGVSSPRKPLYSSVQKIEAPDDYTVVVTLRYPTAPFLSIMASPYNWIYKAENLKKDPQWYRKVENINGTGAFKFVEYVAGSHILGKRNEDYFIKGRPYLDAIRGIYISSNATRVAAIRGGRAHIDLRYISEPERQSLVQAMGDKIRIQEMPMVSCGMLIINTKRKPFDDVRVRRALRLGLDLWKGAEVLGKIESSKWVGGLVMPGSEFAMSNEELMKLEGYGKDIEASRKKARQLLREAGVPEGFKFTILNDDSSEARVVWVIDQWRQIGLNVDQVIGEEAPNREAWIKGNYAIAHAPIGMFLDDPSVPLTRVISADKSDLNFGGYIDRVLDDLYAKQDRTMDPVERKKLVNQMEKRALEEMAYLIPFPWGHRIVAHSPKMRGWKALPSQQCNTDMVNVWLSED